MKASELTGMSDEQIAITLGDTEKHLFQLRFQSATDRLETPSEIQKAKKDIARIKTVQRQRELALLAAATDDELATAIVDLEPKTEGPGKRRAKRAVARLTTVRLARELGRQKAQKQAGKAAQPPAQQPAKGK